MVHMCGRCLWSQIVGWAKGLCYACQDSYSEVIRAFSAEHMAAASAMVLSSGGREGSVTSVAFSYLRQSRSRIFYRFFWWNYIFSIYKFLWLQCFDWITWESATQTGGAWAFSSYEDEGKGHKKYKRHTSWEDLPYFWNFPVILSRAERRNWSEWNWNMRELDHFLRSLLRAGGLGCMPAGEWAK